jgi:ATP-binding cassette subfamily B protein
VIRRLLGEITTRKDRVRYAAAVVATCLDTAFLFAVPQVVREVVDQLDAGEDPGLAGLAWAAARIVGFTAICGAFLYLRGRLAAQASEGIVERLRGRIYAHLSHLPCRYHDKSDTGDLVQRCTSDVETVRVFLATQVVQIGRTILLVLIVVPILLWMHVPMALMSLALTPLIVAFAVLFFRRVQKLFLDADEAEAEMTAVLQENLTGIRVVRAFARQEFECGKFARLNARHRDLLNRMISMLGRYWSLSDVLCFTQFGIVLIGGAAWTLSGDLTLGTWTAFSIYVAEVIWPVRMLGRTLSDAGKAVVSLGRIGEMLHAAPETANGDLPRELSGAVEIEGLTFAYENGASTPALDDLSLSIETGETVALLGPPGSGKSTLVHLLLRLYEYEQGSIRLDGFELNSIERESVREQVGVVLQEPFLYSKTVGENVRLGRSGATEREVHDAAQAACIHTAIEEFEHGYGTLVGERGVTLSGGQRQRVALARALLKRPPILILDDSLSAVDTRTEARILAELERRRGSHTTILIAHRLSSTRLADRIFVLDAGRLVQQGNHEELMKEEGAYRRLWRIQGALEKEIAR